MLLHLHPQILKFAIALLMLISGSSWAQPAPLEIRAVAAPKLDISLVYFLDATGTKTVDQIEQLQVTEFKAFSPDKPVAIKGGALWLRFSATNQTSQQGWRLILPMATVDAATLFNRSAEGPWIMQLGGDTLPISRWAQPGRYPSFVLSDDRQRTVDYLLQVRHERGLFSTLPRVMNESAFITSRQNEHLVLGMYFGLAALVVVLALTRALVYRDAGFASYAIYVALLALTIATVSGISALYVWPEWPVSTVMSPVLSALTAVAADWFVRVVTRPQRFSRWLDRILLTMMVISLLGGLLTIVQPSGWAYTIYSAIVLVNTFVMLSVIVGALWQGDHDSRWVALGFLPIVIAICVPLLRNFGMIPASALTELSIPVASALEAIILFYGLHRRVSQRRSVATRVTRLLNIDPLTGLDTRHALTSKFGMALTTSQRSQQPYALLVMQLANADAIEAKYGRETADRAMVMAASCIRGVTDSGDSIARVGASQFALLIESPISPSAANDVATKVLANALRNPGDLPDDQKPRFHIAIGYPSSPLSSNDRDAKPILDRLVAAATAMEDGSGKAIRMVSVQ
jgi:two-component system, sensor histidine kinase LadS